jgi:hypothetical protein
MYLTTSQNLIMKNCIILYIALTAITNAVAQKEFKNVTGIIETVQPDSIKRHIQYLADDKLMGRQAGSPGYQMAVDYVVKHFKLFGMQPAGENNTYLQTVKIS